MPRYTKHIFFLVLLLALCLPSASSASSASATNTFKTGHVQPVATPGTGADFPTVDANYIYQQLFYMATHFQRREAGYDNNLPVNINGHDEFAAYWSQEMLHNLQGFGAQVLRDTFITKGWKNRPAEEPTVPAFNVEVSVPGITHAEQVVVIGCHYDGEASSTQSANDDGSGCAIELGVAKGMAEYWRSHHVYPDRTLRFVIFDAEEQGLHGSYHYLNSTVNGDVQNIVAMFNEEQNGIAYPLRYLGQLANDLMPFSIYMSPLQNNDLYPTQSNLSQSQLDNISHFRLLMQRAVPAVFAQFRAMGVQALTYHDANNQNIPQPIFTPEQMTQVLQQDDTLGRSDQEPFTLAGLPCATFIGNFTYYDQNAPPGSYPYDQPQDTIQLMNTYADGSSQQSQALSLALALPGMLTTRMLNQPTILGQSASDGKPIAAISDVGQIVPGHALSLNASASFDPNTTGSSTLNYAWDFGDGTQAKGITVSHTYGTPGAYSLALTVTSPTGTRRMSKTISVVQQPPNYADYPILLSGRPRSNPSVIFPVPNDSLTDKVTSAAQVPATLPSTSSKVAGPPPGLIGLILGIVGLVLVVGVVIAVFWLRRKKPQAI